MCRSKQSLLKHQPIAMNIQSLSNKYSLSSTPFCSNMQLQNELHLQPRSLFARNFHWTRDVTLNHDKRRWATAWNQTNPNLQLRCPFLGLNQPPIFTVNYVLYSIYTGIPLVQLVYHTFTVPETITLCYPLMFSQSMQCK